MTAPSLPVKHNLIVGGGWGPSVRQRDAPDASGRLTSFSVEERGSKALPQNSWHVHHVRGRHFNGRQPSSLNKNISTMSLLLSGGGLMCGNKNTSARLCTKNAGGLCARGGIFAGHYGTNLAISFVLTTFW